MLCDAILFDLDGVLVDSNPMYERHWRRWAALHGVSFAEIVAVHHGRPAVQTIALVAPHMDAAVEAARYNAGVAAGGNVKNVRAYAGVRALLESLPEDRWAIVTSANRKLSSLLLHVLDLPIPRVLVTSDDVKQGKPSPDPYLKAAHALGYAPSRCLVIEDAPAGITAARAAGARVVALRTTNRFEVLQDAHAVLERFTDLRVTCMQAGLEVNW